MEEQSWFFTQIYNIYQMDQIWQNACVLWICQLTWKQDFSRVNNRREVKLDKDAWNASKFKKLRKKFISKQSSVLKGGTTLNPSTFGGILDNSPSKQRPFWDVLVLSGTFKW